MMNALRIQLILTLCLSLLIAACSAPVAHFADRSTYQNARQAIVASALSLRGKPYRYGGTGPEGFDCSGLVQYSYQQAGIRTPRTTYQQFRASSPVYLNRVQPGDLLFYRISNSIVSHVGIYVGNGRFIHAPKSGQTVALANVDDPIWEKYFVGAGSLLD